MHKKFYLKAKLNLKKHKKINNFVEHNIYNLVVTKKLIIYFLISVVMAFTDLEKNDMN